MSRGVTRAGYGATGRAKDESNGHTGRPEFVRAQSRHVSEPRARPGVVLIRGTAIAKQFTKLGDVALVRLGKLVAFVRDELHVGRHAMDRESVDRSLSIERAGAEASISGPQGPGLG